MLKACQNLAWKTVFRFSPFHPQPWARPMGAVGSLPRPALCRAPLSFTKYYAALNISNKAFVFFLKHKESLVSVVIILHGLMKTIFLIRNQLYSFFLPFSVDAYRFVWRFFIKIWVD